MQQSINLFIKLILIFSMSLIYSLEDNFKDLCKPIVEVASSLLYSNPNDKIPIIAIGGCPGVGKTFFAEKLKTLLSSEKLVVVILKIDDFIKDKKTREQYGTGWDPRHLDSEALHRMLEKISTGELLITKPTLDEVSREHGTETINLSNVDLILLEGLYALSDNSPMNYLKYSKLGIYISADEEHILNWRWERETKKVNPKTFEQFKKHMEDMFLDYHLNVKPTKKNAHIIINKDKTHNYYLVIEK